MNYTTDMQPFFQYKVVGEMIIPKLSLDSSTITYSAPVNDVFYNLDYNDAGLRITPISIIPYETAFMLRLTDGNNRVIASYPVIVTSVEEYTVRMSEENTEIMSITFHYLDADKRYAPVEITTIPPVISHVFVCDNFIGVIYEGDPTYVVSYIHQNMQVFQHGSKLYYQCNIKTLKVAIPVETDGVQTIDADKRDLAVVLIGSTMKIPDEKEHQNFNTWLDKVALPLYRPKN